MTYSIFLAVNFVTYSFYLTNIFVIYSMFTLPFNPIFTNKSRHKKTKTVLGGLLYIASERQTLNNPASAEWDISGKYISTCRRHVLSKMNYWFNPKSCPPPLFRYMQSNFFMYLCNPNSIHFSLYGRQRFFATTARHQGYYRCPRACQGGALFAPPAVSF